MEFSPLVVLLLQKILTDGMFTDWDSYVKGREKMLEEIRQSKVEFSIYMPKQLKEPYMKSNTKWF